MQYYYQYFDKHWLSHSTENHLEQADLRYEIGRIT